MKLKYTTALAALAVLATPAAISYAAGLWTTLPVVGQSSYCASVLGVGPVQSGTTGQGTGTALGTNVICAQTVPAGPPTLTGNEGIPADTVNGAAAAGAASQTPTSTVVIGSGTLAAFSQAASTPRNLIRNGDISVNPFQRGTTEAPSPFGVIGSTQYTADGFSVQAGSGNTNVVFSRQTGTSDVVAGQFTASLRVRRTQSSTDNAQICEHAVLTSANSVPLIGNKFVYSFWLKTGTGFSSTASAFTATVGYGTGTDQSPTSFQAGTWTNQGTATTSTLTGTTTFTQYTLTGTIPTTSGGNPVNQVGTDICWTPSVGPSTTDFIETSNHQLEVVQGNNTTPSAFEHHNQQQDLAIAQSYFWLLKEGSVGTPVGICYGTATFICNVNTPVQLRSSTIPLDGGAAIAAASVTPLVVGSFKLAGGAGAMSLITSPTATASSTNLVQFTITNTDQGAQAPEVTPLQSGAIGGGLIGISAEL